jgi:hypothetical protein
MTRSFDEALKLMSRHDNQAREEGFRMMLPLADAHQDELLREYETAEDIGLKRWLLDILSNSSGPSVVSTMLEALESPDDSLRHIARGALSRGSKAARTSLWHYDQNHPEAS